MGDQSSDGEGCMTEGEREKQRDRESGEAERERERKRERERQQTSVVPLCFQSHKCGVVFFVIYRHVVAVRTHAVARTTFARDRPHTRGSPPDRARG